MMVALQLPSLTTDNGRFLLALQQAWPEPVWNPNAALGMTAHSRASNLRALGWRVKSVSVPSMTRPGRRCHGYVLQTPREQWPSWPDNAELFGVSPSGQVVIV